MLEDYCLWRNRLDAVALCDTATEKIIEFSAFRNIAMSVVSI